MRRHTIPALVAAAALGLTACSGSGSEEASPSESSAEATTSAEPSESGDAGEASTEPEQSSAARDVVDDPPDTDWQAALDAARDEFSGDVSEIELEPAEGGGLEYKIELIGEDAEYAVQLDADTLDKLSEETEGLDDDAAEEHRETFDPAGLIDLDEAVSAARDEQDGAITSWQIEGNDDGSVLYEFDILPAGASDDIEVQIDAEDGSVIHDS